MATWRLTSGLATLHKRRFCFQLPLNCNESYKITFITVRCSCWKVPRRTQPKHCDPFWRNFVVAYFFFSLPSLLATSVSLYNWQAMQNKILSYARAENSEQANRKVAMGRNNWKYTKCTNEGLTKRMQPLAVFFLLLLLVRVWGWWWGKYFSKSTSPWSGFFPFYSAERNQLFFILVYEILCSYHMAVLDPPASVVLQTKHSLFGKWNKGISLMRSFH